jgi:Flp pilus assembly protein protease CpaA
MATQLDLAVFLFFALRISSSDIADYTIRNWDLGYFLLSIFIRHGSTAIGSSHKYFIGLALITTAVLLSNWVGAGDIKLLLVLTTLTSNYEEWLAAVIGALIFAGLFTLCKLLWTRKTGALIAMAPFLFLGFIFQIR